MRSKNSHPRAWILERLSRNPAPRKTGLRPPSGTKLYCDALTPRLCAAGFTNQGRHWTKFNEDIIHHFELFRSKSGESYYFDLGVNIRHIRPSFDPNLDQSHIRTRATDAVSNSPELIARIQALACPMLSGLCGATYREELARTLAPLALDWFARFQTIDAIKLEIMGNNPPESIHDEVWSFYGIPENPNCVPF